MWEKKKWFVSHPSGGRQHAPVFFDALEKFDIENRKVDLIWPQDQSNGMHTTKQDIELSDLIIAEVSMASTGSGIELGWAHAAGKPIIAFHQGLSPVSPALSFVADAVHIYMSEEDIVKVLKTLS